MDIKNSRKSEGKELICPTHGHELRRNCWKKWWYWAKGSKGENWDNYNSTINKIYFKKDNSRNFDGK